MVLKILGFYFFILCTFNTKAQQSGFNLSGVIVDRNSKITIEFATAELLNASDSSLVAGTLTDNKGSFSFDQVKKGNYLLRYSFIGYEKMVSPVTVEKTNLKLGSLQLIPISYTLNDVVVTSTRATLNTSIDRKSYDVTKDIMAQSGTASDILKNIPSVEVDLDGNVSLRGAGDVMILINGRPSPLFGKLNKAEVLQQFPANTIEKIEVITNPSARYKPDGTSGIINIILKRNVKGGWNGSLIGNTGNRDRYNSSLTLNYNPGTVNIFGNLGIRKDSRRRTNTVSREYFDTIHQETHGYYTEDGISLTHPLALLATLGFTLDVNKNNSIGLSGNYSNRNQVKNDINTKLFSDRTHLYTSYLDRLRYDPEYEKEKNVTAFYEHKFRGEDHTLRIELNIASSKEREDNHYENKYYFPSSHSTYDNTSIFQGEDQQLLNIDYAHSISEDSKLEAGYSGSFNQQNFDFYGEYFDFQSAKFIQDNIRTNQFLFNQSIHSWYGTFQKDYKKFGYSIGLRLEESIIKGYQVIKDTSIANDYSKLYPTLHMSYILSDQSQLQLNYSRRVHRAEGDDINPFPEYQDPYNVRAGNAKLLPEVIHSVEFGVKWQNRNYTFVPSLYYRYKQNGFTQITVPINDTVLLTTIQNLSNDQSVGLEFIFSAKAGNFFSSNLSTNLFYNQITATNLGYFNKRNILSFSINFNSTCSLTENTKTQLSAIYYSSRITPQGKKYPAFVLNAGIRQDLFNKKWSLTLTASDILRTLWQKTGLNTSYLKQLAIGRRDGQIVYLGVSYRFGKTIKKAEDKIQFEKGE
jgi:outer membrane receptor protein involved in Fe transport